MVEHPVEVSTAVGLVLENMELTDCDLCEKCVYVVVSEAVERTVCS